MRVDYDAARQRLGRFLRSHREDAGLSQAEMAQKLGTSQASISKFEAGTQRVDRLIGHGYGLNECYPSAPTDPEDRRDYFAARNRVIQKDGT